MSSANAIAVVPSSAVTLVESQPPQPRAPRDVRWSADEVALIRRTVASGVTDDEFKVFLYTAVRTGLDPLRRQIHAIKRWNKREGRNVMTIQTGIDDYRLIAERTGMYAPGPESKVVESEGKVVYVTAYVKKLSHGTWHEVPATAYYEEYVQTYDGEASGLWGKMPRLMTSKCAEALAIRKAFPDQTAGIYTFEEMAQADSFDSPTVEPEVASAIAPAPGATVAVVSFPEAIPACPSCHKTDSVIRSRFKDPFYCRSCKHGFDNQPPVEVPEGMA